MSGTVDIGELLRTMRPTLRPGSYVFVSVPQMMADLEPIATVREVEGLTLVLTRDEADTAGLDYDFVAAMITLQVHSALEAVGLTAAVATELAGAGISCNVIAGYFHDHLFVPTDRADDALRLLEDLAER
jgi:hypothetical protein